ncbi:flagellar biosynthesis protein FlhF [Lederbergia citrea]|uniref:Flagellar biosynthesis protein FlhF n=1 Tax=Lederbergia citrea TaxID=2833581 RepID=A0A942UMU4_9BACI|nr:flagellar biosynthesis protein FlhF [Lederbergia citrea]MBS4177104.1 flagellar biosynthesis protein FlhF [Lederbergia citrea]MBS4203767.1 flagellar biosynthesis protein FlhF [Lederbergia citrea]MBS4221648.1 flagellar biosynthesis protein FlhF [Lederbergia citrea]
MNIKKIIAPTMPEAMRKIKAELGDNAVILNSKVIYHGGFLGMFRKKKIEVIAALDKHPVKQNKKHKSRKLPEKVDVHNERNIPIEAAPINDRNHLDIIQEIAGLKKELEITRRKQGLSYMHYPELIQTYISQLQEAGLEEEFIDEIGEGLLKNWREAKNSPTIEELKDWCHTALTDHLLKVDFKGISYNRKFVTFVGPTGVGKTTTIAKLAAEAVLEHKKKVAFITTDTYRIAAIEQLKTYAELLDIPIEIVYSPDDFQTAAENLSHCDLVFIDTAGRNYRDMKFINELKKMFGEENNMETFLVLSLSMKEQDIRKIANNFLEMKFNKFIFTKADETRDYGVMYNIVRKHGIGAAYITTGQEVPDDITALNPEMIADYLLRNEDI